MQFGISMSQCFVSICYFHQFSELKIHISRETKELLDMQSKYVIDPRAEKVELKVQLLV